MIVKIFSTRSVNGLSQPLRRPNLNLDHITNAICAYREKTGMYPNRDSGPVDGTHNLTWSQIDGAMKKGSHGLPKLGSLKLFIAMNFGVRHPKLLLPLVEREIVKLAQTYYEVFGSWPNRLTKEQVEGKQDTWQAIDSALRMGARGLPGGDSLRALLRRNGCGVKIVGRRLSIEGIVALAQRHHGQARDWPTKKLTEAINGEEGLHWRGIDKALREKQKRVEGV